MTPNTANEPERQRLISIASEYEDQGYKVKLQPSPDELPDFLSAFEPDLIATGKGETVVVEVKTREELRNEQSVAA
jgi:Holliday junction resolvase